ncbi:unnamed protein product [Rotaria socialis]|uniref:Oxaloacetate tautomerase FAHD1, mitochondrial n=2 Tax=Rotaria socialis TaxID=392032 RepID=A0A820P1G4_9BILA|nr:unnamed protein product [Rotaria socialis]CAF3211570.1 unnamed protein product [Rotaria socialis]CAF3313641.1 unnamed protein product [Rotaria socialis]CAF3323156.1 unnamed protein product [Rotaria socialis]CAF4396794.1 unnamed protein product [Rotaria socialis]
MTSTPKNFRSICTKIICVGRNYSEHASELGNTVPTKPIIFMKPPSAFVIEPNDIKIPSEWDEVHHEVELGVIIDKKCQNVSKEDAAEYIAGYCLALDMTSRKLQNELKDQGLPWLLAKGFDTSCPCGDFIDKNEINLSSSVNLWLSVNGTMRQNGHTRDMIFSVPDLIAFISKYITLEHGDLILTGTPAGVGAVKRGDHIEAGINGENDLKYTMKFNIA